MDENKLKSLEKENEQLRQEVDSLRKHDEEYQSYRVYMDARKKLLGFVSVAFVVLTAFGIVSIKGVIEEIKQSLNKEGTKNIVVQIKEDFIKRHRSTISEEILNALEPTIKGRVDVAIRENMQDLATVTEKSSESVGVQSLASALQSVYADKRYYVIGLTATNRKDVVNEFERVKRNYGPGFNEEFQDVEIYSPDPEGFGAYTLLISGKSLPYNEANKLKTKAIAAGFGKDTWIWNANETYFENKK